MAGLRRRKVAFLSFDWDYEIVSEYYRGMQAYLANVDDLQLFIFNAFGHHHVSFGPDAGSHTIFSLCNPTKYDGFIVQGNRTWAPNLRQEFVDLARGFGKPVVSINYDLAGACTVGTNNYDAMYDLVDRVLTDCGCTDPAFVNGLQTSVEAQDRARAYRDACAAHRLRAGSSVPCSAVSGSLAATSRTLSPLLPATCTRWTTRSSASTRC